MEEITIAGLRKALVETLKKYDEIHVGDRYSDKGSNILRVIRDISKTISELETINIK
jgi:hypothetical protein